jgi:hypothetical protein
MVYALKTGRVSDISIRRLIVTCSALSAIVLVQPVNSAPTTVTQYSELLKVELTAQFGTKEKLNAAITKLYGTKLSPEKEEVARNNLRTLVFNDAVPIYLARLIWPIFRPEMTSNEVSAAMLEGMAQMQTRGFMRLPTERQAELVSQTVSMAKAISSSDCKALMTGRLDGNASSLVERSYVASLPFEKFSSILNLYKQATEAELAGYPEVRAINQSQAKLADTAWEAATIKRLREKLPRDVVLRVVNGIDTAPSSEVCSVVSERLAAMLDMTEPYRSWQLIRFTQGTQ